MCYLQALGLEGEKYDDSVPPIIGSQINSHTMEEALQLVPSSAAERYAFLPILPERTSSHVPPRTVLCRCMP